jgi:hypothetical protein
LTPPRFYVGGRTTQAGYTAYSLTVADPPQVFFFNYDASVGHIVFQLDYEVVIPMRGGTTVTFDVNGQSSVPDGHGVSNRDRVVVVARAGSFQRSVRAIRRRGRDGAKLILFERRAPPVAMTR